MITTQLQQKREQFVIQIRKQAREEIFYRKRHTDLTSEQEGMLKCLPDGILKCLPDEMIVQIYKSFMLKDFKTLDNLLFRYNEQFLINMVEKQYDNKDILNQYINHFSINQETTQLFMQILQMSDVSQENNIDVARLLCINQVLVILINITFVDDPQILNNLFNHDLLDILLTNILSRMNTRQKLAKNYDIWQSILDSLCVLFINLLLDLQDQRGVQMKIELLKSPFFKIWQYIYKEYPPQRLWILMIQLQHLIFKKPEIPTIHVVSSNRILKQCDYVISEFQVDDDLYQKALELIVYCSQYQPEPTLILTKHLLPTILVTNKCPQLMYEIFINFTSINYNKDSPISEFEIKSHLIEINLLDNMQFWLEKTRDVKLVIQIYKCLNGILNFQYQPLAIVVICHFIPFLNTQFEGTNCFQVDMVAEYLYLLKNLITFQKLVYENVIKLLQELNVMMYIKEILLQGCFNSNQLLDLFETFDLLSIELKLNLLEEMGKNQIVEIFNLLLSQKQISDYQADSLSELMAKWDAEIHELVKYS